MSTPLQFLPSPLPSFLVQTASNAPSPSQRTPGPSLLKPVSSEPDLRHHLDEISSLCDSLELQANAAFQSVEHAFDSDAPSDQLSAFLNGLEALKQRLVATGVGALPVLDQTSAPKPADLDLIALAEKRAKETQSTFAASLRAQEGATAIHDVLSSKCDAKAPSASVAGFPLAAQDADSLGLFYHWLDPGQSR